MAELTKEYFDQKLDTLVTKTDLDQKLGNLVTKTALDQQTEELKTHQMHMTILHMKI